MTAPGPASRLGILVPSSNTNAETVTGRILAGQHDIGVHYSRFPLPLSLEDTVTIEVLGEAPSLLADADLDAIAFHGTAGSWTGLAGDRQLCASLARSSGAAATTASLGVVAALDHLNFPRVSIVFPGPAPLAARIADEYARTGVEVVHWTSPSEVRSNSEIARLDAAEIREMMIPAVRNDIDAVVCIGTNMRSAYLADEFEREFSIPVVDSAVATLWHVMKLAGIERVIPGWGPLFRTI